MQSFKLFGKKVIAIALSFACALGLLWACGIQYSAGPSLTINSSFVFTFAKYTLAFFVACIALFAALKAFEKSSTAVNFLYFNFAQSKPYKEALIYAIAIFLCWLPYLLALYPGCLSEDTFGQLATFYEISVYGEDANYIDHHPIFDTLLIGGVIRTGEILFGSLRRGVFFFVTIQYVFTAASMACVVTYAHRKLNFGTRGRNILLLIVALFPLFPLLTANVSKDAIYSWIFILFALSFIEACRTKADALSNPKFLTTFILLACLVCLTRKTGIYVVAPSILALVICARNKIPQLLTALLCPVCLMFIVMPMLFAVFNVEAGGKQEMFAAPFNQTALYVQRHADDLTEEEFAAIDSLLDMSTLADRYAYDNADPVKGYSERGNTSQYIEYLKVWISEGLKDPATYFDAFMSLESGWLSTSKISVLFEAITHSQLQEQYTPGPFYEHTDFSSATSSILRTYYAHWGKTPILRILCASSFYATFIPLLVLALLLSCRKLKNGECKLCALFPYFISVIMLFVVPVSVRSEGMRYILPMVFQAPIALTWCIYCLKLDTKLHPKHSIARYSKSPAPGPNQH